MLINKLVEILDFIQNTIETNQFVTQYKTIENLCKKAESEKSKTLPDSIIDLITMLQNKLEELNIDNWDAQYRHILEKIEGENLFGKKASENLNLIIETKKDNLKQIHKEFSNIVSYYEKILKHIEQLKNGLIPLTKPSKFIDNQKQNKNLLHIVFQDAFFIQDIEQLEKFLRIWGRILFSFANLTGEETDVIKIYDIESNSITFFAGEKTIKSLSEGTFNVLSKYQKILEIRKLQQELEKLSLTKQEDIIYILNEEEQILINDSTYSVTNDLLKEYEWIGTNEIDKMFKEIQISLKQTLNFIEKGGAISKLAN